MRQVSYWMTGGNKSLVNSSPDALSPKTHELKNL